MEVLACIPELAGSPERVVPASEPAPSPVVEAAPIRRRVSPRSAPLRFPTASVAVLVAVAAICWAAAWRNERQRWDALRQERAERLALDIPPTAGAGRSIAP